LAIAGCGTDGRNGGNGNPNGNPNGNGTPDLSMGGNMNPNGSDGGTGIDPGGPDDTCTNQLFTPQKAGDPDIIIIQDRSGSMADGMPAKYDQMSGAMDTVITKLDMNGSPIEWGLVMFPTDDSCGVSANLPVPVGKNTGPQVIATIKMNMPGGNTPLAAAVKVATDYYGTLNDGRAHYLLIATDGEPNCDSGNGGLPMTCMKDADCPMGQTCQVLPFIGGLCVAGAGGGEAGMAVSAALAKGIKTYVVGIDLGGDSATLDALAQAGGTARMGSPKYYPVTDQAAFETALTNITGQVISCQFTVSSLPMMGETVEVSIGGMMIARDPNHMDGWDLDPNTKTLTFYGQACTDLQMNAAQVDVGYTCPPPG
jgi:hypothetical protein